MEDWIFVRHHPISGYAYFGTHIVRVRAKDEEEVARKLAARLNREYKKSLVSPEDLFDSDLFGEPGRASFGDPIGTITFVHPDDYEVLDE